MFLERLSELSRRLGGAAAVSLVARDGIPVESVSADPELDLDQLAAELLAQVHTISDDHRDLDVGAVRHFTVTTDRLTVMISEVAEGYYLMLVLKDTGSHGRARFELRRARKLFEPDLA